jgi:peptidoglycan hydrolase-like protein with peptidoglycan-binding domain
MTITRLVPALLAFLLPLCASAASVNILGITPGTSVGVANMLSLNIVPSGITSATYSLQDSFSNSSASGNNIEPGGKFSWVPSNSDVGTHTFTFTAYGSEGSASATQTITIVPPPTLTLSAPQPGATVMAGTAVTFNAIANGFTNPTFTVGDMATNPSVQPNNIDSSGHFSWTPTLSDNGDHTITVYVSDSLGHNASKSVSIHVGKGPTLSIVLLKPGASVKPGEAVTFTAAPNDYQPTGYSVWDSFKGSSASSNNMNLSGQFSWVSSSGDIGVHTLTITGVVGAFGKTASTTQTITVLNADGTMPAGAAAPTAAATPAGDTSTLDALKAKLAALQGAIATQSGNATSGSGNSCSIVSYLKAGSSGDEVLCLQKLLVKLGYLSAAPNGNFGPATVAAVKAFQKAKGLEALGVVGPGTRTALNSIGLPAATPATTQAASAGSGYIFEHFMGLGDDDAQDVSALQQRLISLGYFSGPASGYFGPATETAVKKFQKANGIPETGYVASITRAALNK